MSKYIDLEPQVSAYYGTIPGQERRAGICDALRYLDSHPDQVPGRTITRSEMRERMTESFETQVREIDVEVYTESLGRIVTPDPEPTNAEKLETALRRAGIGKTLRQLAEYLDYRGVNAPGADSASKARSDAAWDLNIDRQGGA